MITRTRDRVAAVMTLVSRPQSLRQTFVKTTCRSAWVSLLTVTLTGCYAAREPAQPDDAFRTVDGGINPLRFDAHALPDTWLPEPCSLGAAEDGFEFSGDDYIAQGGRWRESAPRWSYVNVEEIDFGPGNTRQTITLTGPEPNLWTFMFQSPDGSALGTGEFLNAQRAPFAELGRAGVSVAGMGRGCNEHDGSLTVYEISFFEGQLRRLRASFTQLCESRGTPLVGCIRYTAP